MGHINLQTTTLGKATALQQQAERALPFLVSYKDMIVVKESDVQTLAKLRTFSNTILNELSMLAGSEGKLSNITFLNFNGFTQNVPEVLTVTDITIDGKTIAGSPDFLQKAWVNLTPITGKRRMESDPINITDIPRMQQLIARALLVMSYNDAEKIWLEPRLCVFIIESYSMTIASQLQIAFNLNFDEMRFVQTVFAVLMAQLVSVGEDPMKDWPSIIHRCTFLGSQAEIDEKLGFLDDALGGDHSLNVGRACGVIRTQGVARMSQFESRMLYQMFSRTNAEASVMTYALDYPPYWVYLLLKTLSNDKNPILATIFRITDLKKKAMLFAADLKTSRTFIPKVNRNGSN